MQDGDAKLKLVQRTASNAWLFVVIVFILSLLLGYVCHLNFSSISFKTKAWPPEAEFAVKK